MITILVVCDVLIRAARWPRRRLAAAIYQHHRAAGERRALLAECHRLRAQRIPPLGGSMWLDDDPSPRRAGDRGTWTPHPDPFTGWDDPGPWTGELLARVRSAPSVLDGPARPLTAEDWEVLYDTPEYRRCLAAEQAALDRYLEGITAAWHHQQQARGLAS